MPGSRRQNVFLHFLDREMRISVECSPDRPTVLFALLAAVCLVPGRIFCSYSHLWESRELLGSAFRLLHDMINLGMLVPAGDYHTGEEFLTSRRILYAHDAKRYPFYFGDPTPELLRIRPAFRTSAGTTAFLERYL